MAEKLELFYEDENGQVVVDWDSLAAVTSEVFVNRIKSKVNDGYKVVDITNIGGEIEVILISGSVLITYTYNNSYGDIDFTCFSFKRLNKYLALFKENM